MCCSVRYMLMLYSLPEGLIIFWAHVHRVPRVGGIVFFLQVPGLSMLWPLPRAELITSGLLAFWF